ncbi:hypothetical protein ACTFIY_004966 [Dictyostelium cf. discoideum]
MSRKIIPALTIFFGPILILTAITQFVQKDEEKDLKEFKKNQPANYQSNKENNAQIMKFIRDSAKGDKIDFFAGLEEEMKTIEAIKNQSKENQQQQQQHQKPNTQPTPSTPSTPKK